MKSRTLAAADVVAAAVAWIGRGRTSQPIAAVFFAAAAAGIGFWVEDFTAPAVMGLATAIIATLIAAAATWLTAIIARAAGRAAAAATRAAAIVIWAVPAMECKGRRKADDGV